jgi:simple sugar transport system ATP-binding protein
VNQLSAGERQRVELIKCLRRDPSVLIMDEPTSVLTQAESADLFEVLRGLVRSEDRAVILISHKLREIVAATDRVTVLRRGRVVFHSHTAQTGARELARQMVGRDLDLSARPDGAALGLLEADPRDIPGGAEPGGRQRAADVLRAPDQPPALRLSGIVVTARGTRLLDSLSLDARPGEIVGLYGVEGNGQAALGDVLAGLTVPDAGTAEIDGVPVDLRRPGAFGPRLGIIPEDRRRSGVVLDMSVAENLVLKSLPSVSGRFFTSRRRMTETARRLADEFGIVAPYLNAPLRTLSGGNQQRVVLAREMSERPRVLVAAQPTQGLDVGAIEDMYSRLREIAASGVAVLLVSTEIEEVLELSSRVAVISGGRVSGMLPSGEASAEKLGLLVGGVAA